MKLFLLPLALTTSALFLFGCAATAGRWGTTPGKGDLYLADLDPLESQRLLQEDRRAVILDIRTQAEYVFVGHPVGAINIPSEFWDEETYKWSENPDFEAMVQDKFSTDTPIIVMCRSGGRSRRAANLLAAVGFTEAYNMIESFEGSSDPATGLRTVNGWRNRGLPYTYRMDPGLMYRPKNGGR